MKVLFTLLLIFITSISFAANPIGRTLPHPVVNQDSWIMIEIWPDVKDFTLSAYFLDFSYEKNRSLCSATKTVFDRDQENRSKQSKKSFSSYRACMSVIDAINQGYITPK